MLAEFGVLLLSAGVDGELARIVQPVRVVARGWFDGETDRQLIATVTDAVRVAIDEALADGERDEGALNKAAQRAAGRLLGQRFRRQPVLMTAVVVY